MFIRCWNYTYSNKKLKNRQILLTCEYTHSTQNLYQKSIEKLIELGNNFKKITRIQKKLEIKATINGSQFDTDSLINMRNLFWIIPSKWEGVSTVTNSKILNHSNLVWDLKYIHYTHLITHLIPWKFISHS